MRNDDPGPKWPDAALDHDTNVAAPIPPRRYYHVGRMNFIASNGRVTINVANPDFEPGLELKTGDHDMFIYCTLMFLRLRNHTREDENDPNYWIWFQQ